jgi:predicted membrane protein
MAKEKKDRIIGTHNYDRFWTGLVLIIVGGVLLAEKMGVAFPFWLFTWQSFLILLGIITGIKHKFRNASWLIMVGVGGFFLADELIADISLKPYFWPIAIMGLGLLFMFRPKRRWKFKDRWEKPYDEINKEIDHESMKHTEPTSTDDMIDSTSIFGGVKKVITTKDFKGGDIVCFMGGAEINLSQADITGPVTIEIMQAFGGTKLIVPPHWEIRSEAVAIFAGIEDKRPPMPGTFDPNKILILKGTTIFGGIEIKSY